MTKPTMLACILTENDCFKVAGKIAPAGIIVHSTGCNNPYIKRYVQPVRSTPDREQLQSLLGKNRYNNHWNQSSKAIGRQICVHGFIGKLDDGTPAICQTLPWDYHGWHAGGAANNDFIGFEICEDGLVDKAYLDAVYELAAKLCAWLCQLYSIKVENVIGHYEAHARGIASNHGDPRNWFGRFGMSMDGFRNRVGDMLADGGTEEPDAPEQPAEYNDKTAIMGTAVATVEKMQAYLRSVNPAIDQAYLDLPALFLSEGVAEGVRGDIAFAQSCLETGNFKFGGDVKADQNNFAGIGATGNGVVGHSFPKPQLGIRAQIQHLKAYACIDKLNQPCVDPRFQYVTRGCAPYVEWLGQRENPDGKGWASGAGYGSKIVTVLKKITAATGKITVGSVVEFLDSAVMYTPNGAKIPAWVKSGYCHRVTSDTYRGKPRNIGGEECVLLGQKRLKTAPSSPFEPGINTWVAKANLRLIGS